MKDSEKIHTLARKYCMVLSKYWSGKYSKLMSAGRDRLDNGSGDYTVEAKGLFPRYIVLNAILAEIEQYEPDQFVNKEEAKAIIIEAILTAQFNHDSRSMVNKRSEEKVDKLGKSHLVRLERAAN
ncbi:hypothetical protein [Paenibacillus sp. MMS18-CY102]|uniref:hypothetical protein n=1 Tax=Paenibacillus sp. MMS18-CY102 TaxID=2682849 RepID=UPI001365EA0F|nr:hypothetical protein [Paenibacillus sp. MMS18-CY102]MWC26885.1 hypothetical protein [Paenibacillus sp. MMS18-CY102]